MRSLGRELWEVRSNLPLNRIARVLICVTSEQRALLHGFIKKTQKRDIDLALQRMKGDR